MNTGGREEQILDEASRIMRELGYHGASMQEIADRCGLQKGSLYHYFSSKEEILDRILARSMENFRPGLEPIVKGDLKPPEKLRQAIIHHITALCADLANSSVLFSEFRQLPQSHRQRVGSSRRAYSERFREILREGIAEGYFRKVDVRLASFAIFGAMNWVYQWYAPDGPQTPEEIAESFADLIQAALLMSAPQSTQRPSKEAAMR